MEKKVVEMEEKKIFISGSGGQGVLLFGKILATASMLDGKNVTWIPSYGAEMRGGIVDCGVTISSEDIGSPLVKEPSILVAMNSQALEKYGPKVIAGGLVLANRSLTASQFFRSDVEILSLSAVEMAKAAGHTKLANMVMLGVLCYKTKIISRERIEESIYTLISSHDDELMSLNLIALDAGIEYMRREIYQDIKKKNTPEKIMMDDHKREEVMDGHTDGHTKEEAIDDDTREEVVDAHKVDDYTREKCVNDHTA